MKVTVLYQAMVNTPNGPANLTSVHENVESAEIIGGALKMRMESGKSEWVNWQSVQRIIRDPYGRIAQPEASLLPSVAPADVAVAAQ